MKTRSIIIFVLFTVISCKGQESKNTEQKADTLIQKVKSMYYIPTINSNFEKFDFQKTKEEYIKNKGQLPDSETRAQSYHYEEKIDSNRTIHRYYFEIIDKKNKKDFGEEYATEAIFYNNSPFAIKKTFYPNGNIKEKGLFIVSGNFHKGVWYHFDENGKLVHTINNDKIFGFSWEHVEKFMEENKIPMPLGNTYVHGKTTIYRSSPLLYPQSSVIDPTFKSEKKLWSITWKGEEWNQYFEVVLDGDTGKILTKKKYWIAEEPGHRVPDPIIEDFTTVYKTYEGKDYTESEWKIFEQEQYNEHLRKTGRADLIKPTETPKAENKKSSFLADEDDVKPEKKKGFWG